MTSTSDFLRGEPRATLREPADVCEALGIPFSQEQLAAICAPLEPAVIIAGAGSGKTTVMAARVVWLVGTGQVRPEQVLGLTFTRKAAGELSVRVRDALARAGVISLQGEDLAGEQVIMTYDAFAGRVVAEHGLRLGYEGDPLMITGAARYRLASRVVAQAAGPLEHLSRLQPASVASNLLGLDGQITSHLASHDAITSHARTYREALDAAPLWRGSEYKSVREARAVVGERLELLSLVTAYRDLKQRLGVVEFADQMAAAARLVRLVPAVSESLREQFRVVLLDEYQDTSSAQAQLLRGLFSGPDPAHGRGHAVTAVGDPFQAIYGWRGAAASNILRFAAEFPTVDGDDAASYSLTVNRRSGQRILDLANTVAEPLRADPEMGAAKDNVLQAPDGAPAALVRAGLFLTFDEERDWVAEDVLAAHQRGCPWGEQAVLARRNADVGALYATLTGREIPCEIVGLGGLLSLPEVADVVATLRVVQDPTSNADVVRLLTGPRWAIGKADLLALGRRAQAIARPRAEREDLDPDDIAAALEQSLGVVDPSETSCLLDAVADPGDARLSGAARERLAAFGAELAELRRRADEPVLDLIRRVVQTLGLEVELTVTPGSVERAATSQLHAFVDAAASYVDVDGDASLAGLLAWLADEEEQGNGLDQAVPSEHDSVKLLTIHKAKGLEWRRVYVPAVEVGTFPNDRATDDWVKGAQVLPSPLRGDADSVPQLAQVSDAGFKAYHGELKRQARLSEDRLAYVALTRARDELVVTGHWWRAGTAKRRTLSDYLAAAMAHADEVVARAPEPAKDATNPLEVEVVPSAWPQVLDPDARGVRLEAAEAVERAVARHARGAAWDDPELPPTTLEDAERLAGWDHDIDVLLHEAAEVGRPVHDVVLPPSLTASQVMAARRSPEWFAAELLRPMPRPPSRSASFGTRFHAWIEQRFAQQALPMTEELVDLVDDETDVESEAEFAELCERFAAGQFGDRPPAATEHAFALRLGDHLVRGRIDAVYAEDDGSWLVVDWKTSHHEAADPLQLALYRLAWAELQGVPLEQVAAGFCWVRTDRLEIVSDLPDREALVRMLAGLTA